MAIRQFIPEKEPVVLEKTGFRVTDPWLELFLQITPAILVESTFTSLVTGQVNDFNNNNADVVRLAPTGELSFSGLDSATAGETVIFLNLGTTSSLVFLNENAASLAGNRFITGILGDIYIGPGGYLEVIYDATSSRWRALRWDQGNYLVVPFQSGDYTASAGQWPVDPADVVSFAYHLRGHQLSLSFEWTATSVTATPTSLQVALPRQYRAARPMTSTVSLNDNGTFRLGVARVALDGTVMLIGRDDGVSLASATNTTGVRGQLSVGIR